MATVRACDHCGDSYTAQRSDSRYCSSGCRSKATLARKRAPRASVVTMPGATGPGMIEAAVREQLGSQLDTVVGRQAVAAAQRLDGSVSDSAFSPMSRRLHELLDQAAQAAALAASKGGVGVEENPIAFLKSRAERRAHGAAG